MKLLCRLGIHKLQKIKSEPFETTEYDDMEGGMWSHTVQRNRISFQCRYCPKLLEAIK